MVIGCPRTENRIQTISMTNEDSSFPATNVMTEYKVEVAKTTANTTTITIAAYSVRDLIILNTTADTGTLTVSAETTVGGGYSAIISGEAMTFSNSKNYYRDFGQEYANANITIVLNNTAGGWTLNQNITIPLGVTKVVEGALNTASYTLTVVGDVVVIDDYIDVGLIMCGTLTQYGKCRTVDISPENYSVDFPINGDSYTYNCHGTISQLRQLQKYLSENTGERFAVMPNRSSGVGDVAGYGRAILDRNSNNSFVQEMWKINLTEEI